MILYERGELIATIVMDTLAMAAAILARGFLLRVLAWSLQISSPEKATWALRALDFLLDVGLVGTVTILVAFDLAKRIRKGWKGFNADP